MNPATTQNYGYGADNVVEYTMVTAKGDTIKVNEDNVTFIVMADRDQEIVSLLFKIGIAV
jgi:hypothetical protein